MGERRLVLVPVPVGHGLSIRLGAERDRQGPPGLGQQRPDDVLLPRDRARGAARVRRGRPARAGPGDALAAGRDRRAHGAGADLPRVQRGRLGRVRLGAAMSTDTAFALGVLELVGRSSPDRLRVFMLTVVVVDDLVALLVIGIAYSDHVVYGYARRRGGAARGGARPALAGAPQRGARRGDGAARWLTVTSPAWSGGGRARDGPADVRLSGDAARPRARDEPVRSFGAGEAMRQWEERGYGQGRQEERSGKDVGKAWSSTKRLRARARRERRGRRRRLRLGARRPRSARISATGSASLTERRPWSSSARLRLGRGRPRADPGDRLAGPRAQRLTGKIRASLAASTAGGKLGV